MQPFTRNASFHKDFQGSGAFRGSAGAPFPGFSGKWGMQICNVCKGFAASLAETINFLIHFMAGKRQNARGYTFL